MEPSTTDGRSGRSRRVTRRGVLASGTAGAVGLAGCADETDEQPTTTEPSGGTAASPEPSASPAAEHEPSDAITAESVDATTVTADRFRTVRGDTLADIQAAIDEQQYINLEAGTLYEGDTTITLSGGGGPHNQKQYIDARGATINYTGDGKRAIEFIPQGKLDGVRPADRTHSNRVAHSQYWEGGHVYGPGRDVEDSAAIYAEDTFGCYVHPTNVSYAEHGIWFRNQEFWCEANDIGITSMAGNRTDPYRPEGKEGGVGWSIRLDGGPANDDLNGTLSYRTSDVTIDWSMGDLGGLWLNSASMHGGNISIRGMLNEGVDGLRITGGGWNMAARAYIEFESGRHEDTRPVYIGPGNSPPLFINPRIGHPVSDDPYEKSIVNESSSPAICLMHHGIYNNYTEKLLGFSDTDGQTTSSMQELTLDEQDLTSQTGSTQHALRFHDGSGDFDAGVYRWGGEQAVWVGVSDPDSIIPTN